MSVIKLDPSLAADGHDRAAVRLGDEARVATTADLMRFADAAPSGVK